MPVMWYNDGLYSSDPPTPRQEESSDTVVQGGGVFTTDPPCSALSRTGTEHIHTDGSSPTSRLKARGTTEL